MSLSLNSTENINIFFKTYRSEDTISKWHLNTIELANPILDRFVKVFNDTLSSCNLSSSCHINPKSYKTRCDAICPAVAISVEGDEFKISTREEFAYSCCRVDLQITPRSTQDSLTMLFDSGCSSPSGDDLDDLFVDHFRADIKEPLSKVIMDNSLKKRKIPLLNEGLNFIEYSFSNYKKDFEKNAAKTSSNRPSNDNSSGSQGNSNPTSTNSNHNAPTQQSSTSSQIQTGSLPTWLLGVGVVCGVAGLARLYAGYKSRKPQMQHQNKQVHLR